MCPKTSALHKCTWQQKCFQVPRTHPDILGFCVTRSLFHACQGQQSEFHFWTRAAAFSATVHCTRKSSCTVKRRRFENFNWLVCIWHFCPIREVPVITRERENIFTKFEVYIAFSSGIMGTHSTDRSTAQLYCPAISRTCNNERVNLFT